MAEFNLTLKQAERDLKALIKAFSALDRTVHSPNFIRTAAIEEALGARGQKQYKNLASVIEDIRARMYIED